MVREDVAENNRIIKAKYNDPKWIGRKFGNLTVVGFEHKKNMWYWVCSCDCGNTRINVPLKLIKGLTKTCGCGKVEQARILTEKYRTKHGGRHDRLYNIWHGMKQRCGYVASKDYANYGERGISVCREWYENYANFREWAVSHGYADNLTIDRINPNGNYEPCNCRWITIIEQQSNRRNSKKNS